MDSNRSEIIYVERPLFVERAESMLQDIKDPVLLILKGHLLVEEALYECLCARFHDQKFLEKASLRFLQKLYLVRSLHEPNPDQEKQKTMMYQFAEALNTLRNRYAHNLEPRSIADLFPRLCVRSESGDKFEWDERAFSDLAISISFCIGYFWAHAEMYRATTQNA